MQQMNTDITAQLGALELNTTAAILADGILEAGPSPHMPRTLNPIRCSHIDDGALEATGVFAGNPTGPRWTGPCCGRIEARDGSALEQSAGPSPSVPHTLIGPGCHHVEDAALEESAGLQMGSQTQRRTPTTYCYA
jgi:hypothetical protein